MADTIELQTCEHCGKDHNLETMTMMADAWFCEGCFADWKKHFDACEHVWEPGHHDGEAGQFCEKCCGFVEGADFAQMFTDSKI